MKKKIIKKQVKKVKEAKKTEPRVVKYLIKFERLPSLYSVWLFNPSPWAEMSNLTEVKKWLADNSAVVTNVRIYELGGELELKNRLELSL